MKESTAWRLLAEDIEQNVDGRDTYLCFVLGDLVLGVETMDTINTINLDKALAIPPSVAKKMLARFQHHLDWDNREIDCYYGPQSWYRDDSIYTDGEYNPLRVLTCLWLSLEAEEEGIRD